MTKPKQANSLVMQATILATATIVSRIIGMVYNIPLVNILGDLGSGYYGAAQTIYALVLIVAALSIPAAVSKIISERLMLKEYKNAQRIFKCSMIYVAIVGGVCAIATFILAPYIVKGSTNAVLSLRVLTPTIFLSSILSVYRGYFQAYGDMVPTSMSQIVEQIFNAIFSIGATLLFIHLAMQMGNAEESAKYGAAGGTLGTGIAVIAGLIYVMYIYQKRKPEIRRNITSDTTKELLRYRTILKILFIIVSPMILSACIYNINVSVDMIIYLNIMESKGFSQDITNALYGVYNRKYMVLANVPIGMAAAVASAIIPGISGAYGTGNKADCNHKINQAMQLTMVLCLPSAVGLLVLAKPVVDLIYFGSIPETYYLLMLGGLSIVLYGISSVTNGVLQGIGKVNIPVINAVVALVLHLCVLVPLLYLTDLGIYTLIIATVVYAVFMVFLNQRAVSRYLGCKLDKRAVFFVPILSSIVMGIVAYVVYYVALKITEYLGMSYRFANAIGVLCAVLLAVFSYFALMMKIGGYTREHLEAFPKGNIVANLATKMHIIKE